jgi:hypothetical protein
MGFARCRGDILSIRCCSGGTDTHIEVVGRKREKTLFLPDLTRYVP